MWASERRIVIPGSPHRAPGAPGGVGIPLPAPAARLSVGAIWETLRGELGLCRAAPTLAQHGAGGAHRSRGTRTPRANVNRSPVLPGAVKYARGGGGGQRKKAGVSSPPALRSAVERWHGDTGRSLEQTWAYRFKILSTAAAAALVAVSVGATGAGWHAGGRAGREGLQGPPLNASRFRISDPISLLRVISL
ncbi:hypothetical protein AAFF_G00035670 [Aldrovandia affinis]|uniref:Uncharacterized protein n=1 Tax=Aldrovandia affinis TaxID=143900 RepID=A0AAD7WFE8_9TELE|nr:hypothetical protein AAFF_G00035670 [Aldrovandia affinis]